jgi:hypothetical protein
MRARCQVSRVTVLLILSADRVNHRTSFGVIAAGPAFTAEKTGRAVDQWNIVLAPRWNIVLV